MKFRVAIIFWFLKLVLDLFFIVDIQGRELCLENLLRCAFYTICLCPDTYRLNTFSSSSSSSSSVFLAISWVHHFLLRSLRMWPFFNPTIEVVTFHVYGWCMLGVFLLPAFTHLGHECQDLLSLCDGIQTRPQIILSSKRVYREWSQNPC